MSSFTLEHCHFNNQTRPYMSRFLQGLGTNDRMLVRVMVSRCEVDMVQIKKVFYQKYHKTLGSFIKVGQFVYSWNATYIHISIL